MNQTTKIETMGVMLDGICKRTDNIKGFQLTIHRSPLNIKNGEPAHLIFTIEKERSYITEEVEERIEIMALTMIFGRHSCPSTKVSPNEISRITDTFKKLGYSCEGFSGPTGSSHWLKVGCDAKDMTEHVVKIAKQYNIEETRQDKIEDILNRPI